MQIECVMCSEQMVYCIRHNVGTKKMKQSDESLSDNTKFGTDAILVRSVSATSYVHGNQNRLILPDGALHCAVLVAFFSLLDSFKYCKMHLFVVVAVVVVVVVVFWFDSVSLKRFHLRICFVFFLPEVNQKKK